MSRGCLTLLTSAIAIAFATSPGSVFATRIGTEADLPEGKLSLEQALKLAKERNGTVRAALLDLDAARARVISANSAFLPSFIPSFLYNSSQRQGFAAGFNNQEGTLTFLTTQWRLLDSGERDFSLRQAQRNRAGSQYNATNTLRQTLFTVAQQYYNTLRAQELLRVAEAQVARNAEILKATDARIAVGAAAKIERLQVNADLQNARVQALTNRNQVTTNQAQLKGTLGISPEDGIEGLVPDSDPGQIMAPPPLSSLLQEGVKLRPDLISRRRFLEGQEYQKRIIDRQAGLTFNFDFTLTRQIVDGTQATTDRAFQLNASYPIFDGGRRRAELRAARAGVESERQNLIQAERSAKAEIEAAYYEVTQNSERLEAARVAREAAELNYAAALESQKLGANDLLQTLTAQVSLVTAEANYIQAVYDYKISDLRLRLAIGRPMPGE